MCVGFLFVCFCFFYILVYGMQNVERLPKVEVTDQVALHQWITWPNKLEDSLSFYQLNQLSSSEQVWQFHLLLSWNIEKFCFVSDLSCSTLHIMILDTKTYKSITVVFVELLIITRRTIHKFDEYNLCSMIT